LAAATPAAVDTRGGPAQLTVEDLVEEKQAPIVVREGERREWRRRESMRCGLFFFFFFPHMIKTGAPHIDIHTQTEGATH
jgi:hypothetical protein